MTEREDMMAREKSMSNSAVNKAVGIELRRAREDASLTRPNVVDMMSAGISVQTLANYEHGIRPPTMPMVADICEAIGVSFVTVAALALQRAGIEDDPQHLLVDLEAITETTDDRYTTLRRWAANTIRDRPHVTVVAMTPPKIETMTAFLNVSYVDLVKQLRSFTPQRCPRRIEWVDARQGWLTGDLG